MNYTTEIKRQTDNPALAGTFRLLLGLAMMIAGVYFWLFYGEQAEGFGLLFLFGSPFVILTDRQDTAFPKI